MVSSPIFIEKTVSNSEYGDLEYLDIGSDCSYNINIKFPYYNQTLNTYTNKNNFLHNNYKNILKYATTSCE